LSIDKVINCALILLVFLFPLQTRYIYKDSYIHNHFWEYGTHSLYGTELLVWMIFLLSIVRYWSVVLETVKKYWYVITVGFIIAATSVLYSVDTSVSFYFLVRLLEAAIVLFVLYVSSVSRVKLLTALWASGVLQGLLALMQFFTQIVWANKWLGMSHQSGAILGAAVIEIPEWGRVLRAYGSFGWPNSLGIYLAMVWIVGFIVYFLISSKKNRAVITGGQLIILSGLIISFSRGAWLAALAGVICLVGIVYGKKQYFKFLIEQLLFSASIVVVFSVMLMPLFITRFNTTTRLESRSIHERVGQYQEAWAVFKNQPLFGVGPGAYTSFLHRKYPYLEVWDIQPVHNIFILSLVEFGIVIWLVVGVLVVIVLKNSWKHNRIIFPLIIVLFVAGLFDHWLWSMFTGQLVCFFVVGIACNKKLPVTPLTQASLIP
jgi:O-antigen ligase